MKMSVVQVQVNYQNKKMYGVAKFLNIKVLI